MDEKKRLPRENALEPLHDTSIAGFKPLVMTKIAYLFDEFYRQNVLYTQLRGRWALFSTPYQSLHRGHCAVYAISEQRDAFR